MDIKFLIMSLGAYGTLLQVTEAMPDSLFRLFEDFPILGVFLIALYYLMKVQREDTEKTYQWREKMLEDQRRMLEDQRVALKDIYEGNQVYLSNLINEATAKQNKMADRIELLAQQVAMQTATIGEVAKVDDVIDRLLERIDHK